MYGCIIQCNTLTKDMDYKMYLPSGNSLFVGYVVGNKNGVSIIDRIKSK